NDKSTQFSSCSPYHLGSRIFSRYSAAVIMSRDYTIASDGNPRRLRHILEARGTGLEGRSASPESLAAVLAIQVKNKVSHLSRGCARISAPSDVQDPPRQSDY